MSADTGQALAGGNVNGDRDEAGQAPESSSAVAAAVDVSEANPSAPSTHQPAAPTRLYRACLPCRKRKTRCDLGDPNDPSEPPCARCRREGRGKEGCVFVEGRRGGRRNIDGATTTKKQHAGVHTSQGSKRRRTIVDGQETGVDGQGETHQNGDDDDSSRGAQRPDLADRRLSLDGDEPNATASSPGFALDPTLAAVAARSITSPPVARHDDAVGRPRNEVSNVFEGFWYPSINPLRPGEYETVAALRATHDITPSRRDTGDASMTMRSQRSAVDSSSSNAPGSSLAGLDALGTHRNHASGTDQRARIATGLLGVNSDRLPQSHASINAQLPHQSILLTTDAQSFDRVPRQISDLVRIGADLNGPALAEDDAVITPSSIPSTSTAAANHLASPAGIHVVNGTHPVEGLVDRYHTSTHDVQGVMPASSNRASKRRRLSSRRAFESAPGHGQASITTATDPRQIVMSEMHNESDALSILAKAATGAHEHGRSRQRDGLRRRSSSSQTDDERSETGSNAGERPEEQGIRGARESDESEAEDGVQHRNGPADATMSHRQGAEDDIARRSQKAVHEPPDRLRHAHPDSSGRNGQGVHMSDTSTRAHHASVPHVRPRLDHFPLIEQDLLDVDHLLQLVRSFFKQQHPIFPLLAERNIPQTDDEIAVFACEEVELATVIIIVASRWETGRAFRRIHRQSWEIFRVSSESALSTLRSHLLRTGASQRRLLSRCIAVDRPRGGTVVAGRESASRFGTFTKV